jgi:hypothetical protein
VIGIGGNGADILDTCGASGVEDRVHRYAPGDGMNRGICRDSQWGGRRRRPESKAFRPERFMGLRVHLRAGTEGALFQRAKCRDADRLDATKCHL